MPSLRLLVVSSILLAAGACSRGEASTPPASAAPAAPGATCEHGVAKALCARCNPRLEAVFKSKGDWCAEHSRPESQCVLCNPGLAQDGIR